MPRGFEVTQIVTVRQTAEFLKEINRLVEMFTIAHKVASDTTLRHDPFFGRFIFRVVAHTGAILSTLNESRKSLDCALDEYLKTLTEEDETPV